MNRISVDDSTRCAIGYMIIGILFAFIVVAAFIEHCSKKEKMQEFRCDVCGEMFVEGSVIRKGRKVNADFYICEECFGKVQEIK